MDYARSTEVPSKCWGRFVMSDRVGTGIDGLGTVVEVHQESTELFLVSIRLHSAVGRVKLGRKRNIPLRTNRLKNPEDYLRTLTTSTRLMVHVVQYILC